MVYAVIDTNIFVSALITHNSNASTARVLESLFVTIYISIHPLNHLYVKAIQEMLKIKNDWI